MPDPIKDAETMLSAWVVTDETGWVVAGYQFEKDARRHAEQSTQDANGNHVFSAHRLTSGFSRAVSEESMRQFVAASATDAEAMHDALADARLQIAHLTKALCAATGTGAYDSPYLWHCKEEDCAVLNFVEEANCVGCGAARVVPASRAAGDETPSDGDAKTRLWNHVGTFIKAQRIGCPETVYQSDRVIENAYEFIEGCANIAGYDKEDA